MSEYQEELYEVEEVPAPDDLIAGGAFMALDGVNIDSPGEYKRGDILVKSGDTFVKATVSGLSSAREACICARNFTLEEGDTGNVHAYFMGHYSMRRVYVSGEPLKTLTGAEQVQVIESLRVHKIFLQ